MKVWIKLLLLLFSLSAYSIADAQEDINSEVFTSSFVQSKTGMDLVFNGKSHSFTLTFTGVNAKTADVMAKEENQNFATIGENIVQASLVALPQPISPTVNLSKLTYDEIKPTLEGYVNYELEYITKDLKLNPQNIKKEWKTISSQLFLVWYFEAKFDAPDVAKKVTAQIYYTTICFNQVLDINIPLYNKNDVESKKALIEKIASTLKSYDKRLPLQKQ